MSLHDWSVLPGWDGVHQVWIVELLYWIKPRLPEGYRAYIETTPTFAIGAPAEARPDVGVRDWVGPDHSLSASAEETGKGTGEPAVEPDEEVAVGTIAVDTALLVERQGRLISAIELVSPRNKDRPSACSAYTSAYAGYLLRGVHLLLVDVHRRPVSFSFADRIAQELQLEQAPFPAPLAIAYRVGEPAPAGGRFLALWRRQLAVSAPLPAMRLPLSVKDSVMVDLDATYQRAAGAAYLS